jgi:hypothetical protein
LKKKKNLSPMVTMAALCGQDTCLHVHLIGIDLASGAEEGGEASGCFSNGVINLVHSTHVTSLVAKDSDQF